jgi:hypothetical protein
MQNPLDCDFFVWADREMCVNGRRIVQRLKDKEEQAQFEVARVKRLMEANMNQRRRCSRLSLVFIILLIE